MTSMMGHMMGLSLSGHIGTRAADLIDGRLDPEAEERAWRHVLSCPGCRRVVEAEGWTKRQLGSLRSPHPYDDGGLPVDLVGVLHDLDDFEAWVGNEKRPTRMLRRTSLALASAGSLGAAIFGLVALTAPPTIGGEVPAVPASIRTGLPQPAQVGMLDLTELRRTTK